MNQGPSLKPDLATRLDRMVESVPLDGPRGLYLRSRWGERLLHMSDRAHKNRFWFYALRGVAVGGSVTVPPLVAFELQVLATLVSLTVAVLVGLTELMRFGPRWRLYQSYVGRMEREGWQFTELSGSYGGFGDHDQGFSTFVDKVEALIRAFEEEYVREVVILGRADTEPREGDTAVVESADDPDSVH